MSQHTHIAAVTLESLGGIPAEAVDLRILQSKVELGQMLDEKIAGLKKSVDDRLDRQDATLGNIAQGVTAISDRVGKIEDILDHAKGWLKAFRIITTVFNGAVAAVKEGKAFLLAFTAVLAAWMALVQWIHVVWPVYIRPLFH